jgi:hypothetical protein
MTGEAYALSAEMAASKGPFEGYATNSDSMLNVMRMHRDAAREIDGTLAPRDLRARRSSAGIARSRSVRSTATATRRRPCSLPPGRSAC